MVDEFPKVVKARDVAGGAFAPGQFMLQGGRAKYDQVWICDGGEALYLVRIQRDKALAQWKIDVYHKFNGVNCGGIEKKYPSYPMSADWYWLFPAESFSSHPKTHVPMMRHHVMDFIVQRIFKEVRSHCKLPINTTPHILRHSCLTHMAQDMIGKGFPEKMIKAQLKELSGHVMDETLEGYLHLAAPKNSFVVSPIDTLVRTTYADNVA